MLGLRVRLIGLGLVVLTVGCASAADEYQPDPKASEAWNVAHSAGMTRIEDVERETLPSNGGLGRDVTDTGFALSSAFNPPPGISSGMGVGFGVLSLFTASSPDAPNEAFNGFVAWVPDELLSNGEDAEEVIEAAIRKGLDEFLAPGIGLVDDVNVGTRKTTMLGWLDKDIVRTRDCPVEIQDDNRRLYDGRCSGLYIVNFRDADDERRPAPGFQNKKGFVYGPFFGTWNGGGIFKHGVDGAFETEDAFMTAFSAHLPSWIYVYRTYDRETNEPPYMVHQGRRLDFVKPG